MKSSVIELTRRVMWTGRRRTRDLLYLLRGTYRPFTTSTGLSFERLATPHTQFCTEDRHIVHTCDFLPDRLSFSGTPFQDSPHVDFVRKYLTDSEFDYRDTAYYKLAVKGNLPFPCHGVEEAEARCRQFIHLVHQIQENDYQPDQYGPLTFVECADGATMVINGKHRLAILMALGIREFPAVLCFGNEVKALFRDVQERPRPQRFYSKSHKMLEKVGKPLSENQSAVHALIKTIKHSKLETWANVYHPIPFFEFRNLTTQVTFRTPYRRLAMILSGYQDLQGIRVLDMGCNVGFYSFSLAKRGADVTGIDVRPEYIDIASSVARIYEVPVKFINALITPEIIRQDTKGFDVTLCFSMIQWVIDQKGMDYGREVLRAVSEKSEALFFDVSVNEGKACLTCNLGQELGFVYRLLQESTAYRYILHVGDVHPYGGDTRHVFYCGHRITPY